MRVERKSPAEERCLRQRAEDRGDTDDGYSAVQAARPDSLAAGLSDSPAGLAAWLIEKYREWRDRDGRLNSAGTRRPFPRTMWLAGSKLISGIGSPAVNEVTQRWMPRCDRVDVGE